MHDEAPEPLTVPFVLHLHRLLFHHTSGRGGHLKSDQNLIVSYQGGRRETIFTPSTPEETEFLLTELLARYGEAKREGNTHPLLLIAAMALDFLAIHPVADGNGRLARLLTLRELLACGYGVARYISVEQLIFESKNSYYVALYESQRHWHQGEQDIWPWTRYLVSIIVDAYESFEQRVALAGQDAGNKQARVREYVLKRASDEFRRRDVERALPDVSNATIRLVLNELRLEGRINSLGAGRGARWQRALAADVSSSR
ncbi:MAG TPA: Fic family protein [Solirubrobacterales bacterium]|jgi:Fic family protein|nr:Fic family protein [Solirubrobacterales bacterium]